MSIYLCTLPKESLWWNWVKTKQAHSQDQFFFLGGGCKTPKWTFWTQNVNILNLPPKGVLHLPKAPKLACFVLYLKIINIFLKNKIYAPYSKLSKELEK